MKNWDFVEISLKIDVVLIPTFRNVGHPFFLLVMWLIYAIETQYLFLWFVCCLVCFFLFQENEMTTKSNCDMEFNWMKLIVWTFGLYHFISIQLRALVRINILITSIELYVAHHHLLLNGTFFCDLYQSVNWWSRNTKKSTVNTKNIQSIILMGSHICVFV